MGLYLPHDAVEECLGVLRVVHGQLGLLPFHLELVMCALKGLFSQHANPVPRVPLVDLRDDVTHHEVDLYCHTDPIVVVEVHVQVSEVLDRLLVVPDQRFGEAGGDYPIKSLNCLNDLQNSWLVALNPLVKGLDLEPHPVDDLEELPSMVALKTVAALVFSSVDVVVIEEVIHECGALAILLATAKRLLNLLNEFGHNSRHTVKSRNVVDVGELRVIRIAEQGSVDDIEELLGFSHGTAGSLEPSKNKRR